MRNKLESNVKRIAIHRCMLLCFFLIVYSVTSRAETSTEGGTVTGTAFTVSSDGHLLTNYHVIEGCKSVEIIRSKFGVPERKTARVVKTDAENDLALLKEETIDYDHAKFRFDFDLYFPFRGASVIAVGFPLRGLLSEINVTNGIISSFEGALIQFTAPVQPGNSGGPLLDDHGLVIGVVVSRLNAMETFKLTGDFPQNINFAIDGRIALRFVESYLGSDVIIKRDASSIASDAKGYTFPVECQK